MNVAKVGTQQLLTMPWYDKVFFCPKKDFDRFTPGGHVDSDERGVEAQPGVQAPA